MKNFYPTQIIDLGFQVDQIHPKKIQLSEKDTLATDSDGFFVIKIRGGKLRIFSDGNKITEVKKI